MNKKELKILHISSPGFRTAGKLVFDIHSELLKREYKSFVACKENTDGIKYSYSYNSRILNFVLRVRNKLVRIFREIFPSEFVIVEKYSFLDLKEDNNQFRYNNILKKVPFKPDIVVLYALQNFINVKTINNIYKKTGAKIYWLLYDIAPLTGGCHYSWDCRGYVKNCGKCPSLSSKYREDISRKNWNFKMKHLSPIDISVLAVSEWVKNKSLESSLFKDKPVYKWMIPMDESFSKNKDDRSEIRKSLNLLPDEKYILFGAVKTTDERKGIKYLVEALKVIKDKKLTGKDFKVLVLGRQEDFDSSSVPFPSIKVGFISERERLINYYRAAYIVIVPSVEDCGPLMISEAIACGTPVVSFEMGSAFDLVHSGLTGYRAKLMDSYDLAKGIAYMLNLSIEEYKKISENCITISAEKTNINRQVDKLIEIIAENS